ncbi:MAG TPA: response regulator [Deltaproteobacteria bacterium]|nr:response regulator [Deltaproteobacteria bacterium]HPR51116.1 response regulator [Deltaproteobacteria bacterium]
MSLKRKKIVLVVDENRDVRSFIRAILTNGLPEYALEVLTHPSSDTALQVIENKNGNIDLISTNIHRPGMNGYRFIEIVKQKYPHIKVLICSAHAGIQELQQFFDDNLVDGYIRKPFQAKEYLNRVKNIFSTQNVVRMNFS